VATLSTNPDVHLIYKRDLGHWDETAMGRFGAMEELEHVVAVNVGKRYSQ